ncbi:YihA family ribosome biogenesis GTP-binding protein [Pseudolysobacter antarcticus]|uniref:Probable GTP-binding protein EngB n=1 Tax=Pseudolysobacter antarcticus TaxID=2511995 RepID=A0A411HP24_9GAMM|nr:ribosome biogenesis GTP-binding protein YihA/YsxC [Pseudolysobacter antarcticus]QBB72170.1 YihA family ribosome biogenesis GTP-binding protein [Pseudolysobacter antarcticus]
MKSNPFAQAAYALSAHQLEQLPDDSGLEIAFAGRSNAGKSSAINAICDHVGLARTSKTPGRTQQLVVFTMDSSRRLIDLPGYGYAEVPQKLRDHWRLLIDKYLRIRDSLRGIVLIMDARHPLKEFDQQMLTFCAAIDLPCHCLITKADKLTFSEGQKTLATVKKQITAISEHASAQLFSSSKKTGVEEARKQLGLWLGIEL